MQYRDKEKEETENEKRQVSDKNGYGYVTKYKRSVCI